MKNFFMGLMSLPLLIVAWISGAFISVKRGGVYYGSVRWFTFQRGRRNKR